ncbi:hypothetical protein LEN26_005666 [Aphanomyces euteiches]|nr:hypothetical protein AeMF1_016676 [Aphanomyces euteiches]KAH9137604.1 hypothetical protein LEN26_005666 [Aphanomyces euteiches]KAH9193481.1 hypothetical protein AeNC1_004541 [Aphanomyces euteiches]
MVQTEDAGIFILWVMHLYFPIALALFVQRSNHSAIKYRQPEITAVTGGLLATFTLARPLITCFGEDSIPISMYIFVDNMLLMIAGVSFILGQAIVVVKFAVTELLIDPRQATEDRVRQVQSLRWLLYPRVQIAIWTTATCIVCTPMIHVIRCLPDDLTIVDLMSSSNPYGQTLSIITATEIVLATAISWALTRRISRVVDNFGLRATYLRIAKYVFACLICCGVITILPFAGATSILDEIHASTMIILHGAHVLCVLLIVMPLRQSYLQEETHRNMHLKRHAPAGELDYKVLYRFLSTDEGYSVFLAFCRRELETDLLLAWQFVEMYKRGQVPMSEVYAKVLDPQSTFHVPELSSVVRKMYDRPEISPSDRRRSWVETILQPVRRSIVGKGQTVVVPTAPSITMSNFKMSASRTFFNPLSAELLRLLYRNVLPRFEELSPARSTWIAFRNGEKAMASLDAVDNMVRKTMVVAVKEGISMTPNLEDIPRPLRIPLNERG